MGSAGFCGSAARAAGGGDGGPTRVAGGFSVVFVVFVAGFVAVAFAVVFFGPGPFAGLVVFEVRAVFSGFAPGVGAAFVATGFDAALAARFGAGLAPLGTAFVAFVTFFGFFAFMPEGFVGRSFAASAPFEAPRRPAFFDVAFVFAVSGAARRGRRTLARATRLGARARALCGTGEELPSSASTASRACSVTTAVN